MSAPRPLVLSPTVSSTVGQFLTRHRRALTTPGPHGAHDPAAVTVARILHTAQLDWSFHAPTELEGVRKVLGRRLHALAYMAAQARAQDPPDLSRLTLYRQAGPKLARVIRALETEFADHL
ncbi:hypothetical protein [Nocardia yamanashiensis]|uniref:hypothetical protein n=1 Tax=Nocardia yamanashiensis TaxID=209247 RepID=UPI000834FD06|nr:hypothetical protein [Nocardia yamanashiensis]